MQFSCRNQDNEVFCPVEEVKEGYFSGFSKGSYFLSSKFANADRKVTGLGFTGNSCVELNDKSRYGLTYNIPHVVKGMYFDISVMRKSNSGFGVIIASFNDCYNLQFAERQSIKNYGNWDELNLQFFIPSIADNKLMKVFVMNENEDTCYFDDLKIRMRNKVDRQEYPEINITDNRDNQEYHAILVEDIWWMTQNLNYELKEGSYCYNEKVESKLGRLYTWTSAQSACPSGWLLPSDNDWMKLESYLGMPEIELNKFGDRRGNIAVRVREFGDVPLEIIYAGTGSDSIVPAFYNLYSNGYYWTSTAIDSVKAICREFNQWTSPARFIDNKEMKFSIRCIKKHNRYDL